MEEGDKNYSFKPMNNQVGYASAAQAKQKVHIRVRNQFFTYKKLILTIAIAVVLLITVIVLLVNIFVVKDDATSVATGAAASYAKQLPQLSTAVKNNPNDPAARKQYAVALYATKDLEGAREQYEEAAKLNGQDAAVFNNLGNVYRDLGEIDNAIKVYRQAIELDPTFINPYVNLANIQLYSQNNPDAAIETYKQALGSLPGDEQIELLLGLAYEHKGDKSSAKQTYEAILVRNPDNAAAKANLERLQ